MMGPWHRCGRPVSGLASGAFAPPCPPSRARAQWRPDRVDSPTVAGAAPDCGDCGRRLRPSPGATGVGRALPRSPASRFIPPAGHANLPAGHLLRGDASSVSGARSIVVAGDAHADRIAVDRHRNHDRTAADHAVFDVFGRSRARVDRRGERFTAIRTAEGHEIRHRSLHRGRNRGQRSRSVVVRRARLTSVISLAPSPSTMRGRAACANAPERPARIG